MKFVTVRELRLQTPRVLKKVSKGGKVIITNRGKPRAALVRLTEEDIEDLVLTHPSILLEVDAARREYEAKGGVSLEEARRKLKIRPR
ncbi:MAG: type II toxin-antitoxin system prevent-host-death family antitoxin [Candidatus Rokubacteria bacterium]|nr:type II toxin-antitoxin system prevent-host-death family antitoxin [Candidatus Rokubacteria bacterium]